MKTWFRLMPRLMPRSLPRWLPALVVCSAFTAAAQDIRSHLEQMKAAYSASGGIVILDGQTLVITPNMPAPICAMPRQEDGKTTWYRYAFPLSSITVPLAEVDESILSEDHVFTNPEATRAYKPGDIGDTTLVVIVGLPGKKFRILVYDRDKLAHLGPGPHSSSQYGQMQDEVEAFGLIFTDSNAAHAFVTALKNAVILARTQAMAR
jgi:hypothetical protein